MELLARCRDFALPFYSDLLRSAQHTLRERLFEQAEKGGSNDEQRCFFEAIQRLNDCGPAMQEAFAQQLQHGYQRFLQGDDEDQVAPQRPGNLTLVAREQLEDQLAISMIVSRAGSQHAEALWKLNRRLAVLRGGQKVTDDSNPFGPAKVGMALRQAMAELQVDFKARIFIYKHLGRLLLAVFGKVFDALNQTLVDGGVLANLRFSISKSADAQLPPTAAPPPVAEAALQRRMYASIVEALRLRAQASGPRQQTVGGISYAGLTTGNDGAAENFSPMDFALVLSALQQAPELHAQGVLQRPLPIDVVEHRLFTQLKKQAKPGARHQLGERDADTVDLVGMIFRYMLDDPKLPDVVKSLLSHLHTPYLKLAILDPNFLLDQQHPARLLLNRMAETGARWVQDDKERVALPKLKTIVETILRGFIDDLDLFARLLEDFDRFRDSLDKRAEMVEKRNRSAQEGIERLNAAKQRAATEIAKRVQGLAIPLPIQQLLQKPWTDFLAFNLLRNGDTSLSWKAALKVVDGVLWSVQNGKGRSAEEFQRYQQQLEQTIAEGLHTIGYDAQVGAELLSALRAAQQQAFNGEIFVHDECVHDETVVHGEAVVHEADEAGQNLAHESQLEQAARAAEVEPLFTAEQEQIAQRLRSQIAFGTLFEFDRAGQPPQQLKLAWFSQVSAHYMFVNQAGIKQRLEGLTFLVHGLSTGSIRIVEAEQRGFMERAFQVILNKLNLA